MSNIIYNGDDPNLVLPNASSINTFTTLSYKDVYGSLDGSGVSLNTNGAMFPEEFRQLPVWRDLINSIEQALGSPIATYIQSLLGMREPYFASTDPSIDRTTLLRIMNLIGFQYAQNDIFSNSDLQRFVRHTPMFWMEKGNRNFIQYMSYVINAQLQLEYLWTSDYINFYQEGSLPVTTLPNGSTAPATPIWAPSKNLIANQFQFANGGTGITTFPILGTNGKVIASLVGVPTFYSKSSWAGTNQLYSTSRTNLLTNSDTIGISGWTNSSVTATTTNGPDGTSTASILTPTTTTAYTRSGTIPVTSPNTYTASVYAQLSATNQVVTLRLVDGTTPTTILASANFQAQSGQYVASSIQNGTTVSIYPLPVAGWFRLSITVSLTSTTSVAFDILPDSGTGALPLTGDYGQVEVGSKPTSYILTSTSVASTIDYSLTGNNLVVPTVLPSTEVLLWSGTYNQMGTWYQTSHVYIAYDVDKFASSVNSGFTSQQSMEQFFYSVAPIELVVRGFVLNMTTTPMTLYLAGDVEVMVFQPSNVDASTFNPNPLYPLPN